MEKKPERHEKKSGGHDKGRKGNARGKTPASKETVLCRRVRRAAFVPAFFGRMKQETDFCRSVIISGRPGNFRGADGIRLSVLVRIMRHRSASPAKSQAFPQLGKAEPARFLGGKITQGFFCLKPAGLERDTVRTSELPSKRTWPAERTMMPVAQRMDEVCKLSALFRFSAEIFVINKEYLFNNACVFNAIEQYGKIELRLCKIVEKFFFIEDFFL